MFQPFEQNNLEIRLISRRNFLFQYHANLTLFLQLFFKQVSNGSHFPTIFYIQKEHIHLKLWVNPKKMAKKPQLFLASMWETGLVLLKSKKVNEQIMRFWLQKMFLCLERLIIISKMYGRPHLTSTISKGPWKFKKIYCGTI